VCRTRCSRIAAGSVKVTRVVRRTARYAARDREVAYGSLKIALARHRRGGGPGSITLLGRRVHYADVHQLAWLYEEIFVNRAYDFTSHADRPLIIDAGANIGLATLFFKRKCPSARILAFEANPGTCSLLERNVAGLGGVTVVGAALAEGHGTLDLHLTTAGDIGASLHRDYRLIWHDEEAVTTVRVPTVPLSDYLGEPVELLKLDVEGSEGVVLREAGPSLRNVSRIRMEFHRFPGQQLQPTLDLLEHSGFDYAIGEWEPDPTATGVATCVISGWRSDLTRP
jgi:FkbM family methyltransferase